MSEKKTMPCVEGLVALTEAELDAASGGMAVAMPSFRGFTLASFLPSISSFVSEALSASSAFRTSTDGITVIQSNTSSGSTGSNIQTNVYRAV